VARACRQFLGGAPDRLLVSGGGAENPAVLAALSAALPRVAVERVEQAGVPAAAVEAMAFSLMGRNALLGIPNHLPRCTGASRAAVLGELVPGRSGIRARS
jgi:anhydro-N-acetylmuramic acid kinase